MELLFTMVVPLTIAGVALYGLGRGVDVYDALVSKRCYKDAFSAETAMDMILAGQCGVFNPRLLECFRQVEPELRRLYRPQGGV